MVAGIKLIPVQEIIEAERNRRAAEGAHQRWAITHVGNDGLRRLTFGKQGRDTYLTAEAAQTSLDLFRQPHGLPRVLSPAEMLTLRVQAVECYAHGDPIHYYHEPHESTDVPA